jgi:hypothetical protein
MDWFKSRYPLAKPPRSQSKISFGQAIDGSGNATLHHHLAEVQQIAELHAG